MATLRDAWRLQREKGEQPTSWTYTPETAKVPEETDMIDDIGNGLSNIARSFVGAGRIPDEVIGNLTEGLGNALEENSAGVGIVKPVADALKSYGQRTRKHGINPALTALQNYVLGDVENTAPANYDSWTSAILNSAARSVAGLTSGAASMVHADDSADKLEQIAQRLYDPETAEVSLSSDYILSPHGAIQDVVNGATSMALMAPLTLAFPEAAALNIAARFGGNRIVSGLLGSGTNALRRYAAKGAANTLPFSVRYAPTSALGESFIEGGHVRRDNLKQGMSDADATAAGIGAMLTNLPYLVGSNFVESMALGAPLGKFGKGGVTRGLATGGQIAGRAALQGANQSFEEAMQKAISNAYTGKPYGILPQDWTEDQTEEFKRALAFGLATGGIGGIAQGIRRPDENTDAWQRGLPGNLSVGGYSDRYNKAQVVRQRAEEIRQRFRDAMSRGEVARQNVGRNLNRDYRNYQNDTDLDKFMQAIAAQESGGNYDLVNPDSGATGAFQIMPENWASWAQDAGLSPDAEMTPENQRLVAANKMREYYQKFGNWRDVATAWYGGEGAVGYSEEAKNRPQGEYPSINEYADQVMARLENIGGEETSGRRNSGNVYRGENGSGEGTYWIKQTGGVSYEGAQPQTMNAIDVLGKWFYDKTGKPLVVTAVTNGTHADGEHSHGAGWKVDVNDYGSGAEGTLLGEDGGKGTLTDEFIRFGQSIGLGMNWEGDHIDVAVDGTQWEGENAGTNYGGFNPEENFAGDENFVADTVSDDTTGSTFDLSGDDEEISQLYKDFVSDKTDSSIEGNNDEFDFMYNLLGEDGNFNDTPENRAALNERYGEELKNLAAERGLLADENNKPETTVKTEQTAKPVEKAGQEPTKIETKTENLDKAKEGNKYFQNQDLRDKVTKVRDTARDSGDLKLMQQAQSVLNSGKADTMKKFLEDNGVKIEQPKQAETQTVPETQTTSENENPVDSPKSFANLPTATKVASRPVSNNPGARKKQGRALTFLARKNNINFNRGVTAEMLENGYPQAIRLAREQFQNIGLLPSENQNVLPEQEIKSATPENKIEQIPATEINRSPEVAPVQNVEMPVGQNQQTPVKQNAGAVVQPNTINENPVRVTPEENSRPESTVAESVSSPEIAPLEQNESQAVRQENPEQTKKAAVKGDESENISNGKKAVEHILKNHDEVKAAMHRPEIGDIDFLWGDEGTENKRYENGYGISKILKKHGQKAVDMIPEVIAKGEFSQKHADRVYFDYDGYKATVKLTWDGKKKTWLVTNFENKKEAPGAAEVVGRPAATATEPSSGRADTSSADNITQRPEQGKEKSGKLEGLDGKTATVKTDGKKKFQVRYRVVEADDIITSHNRNGNETLSVNEEYPKELQPRDREKRVTSITQVLEVSNNLDPEELLDSRNANQGAPVVRDDGVVYNGNMRTIALKRAYEKGKADEYKETLIENAEDFGINPDEIAKMEKPVLVREVIDNLDNETITELTQSATGGSRMSSGEQAKIDAGRIKQTSLEKFVPNANGDLTTAANREFVENVLADIATPDEINGYTDNEGNIDKYGIARVQSALFALAYGDGSLTDKLNSLDNNIANITRALTDAAVAIAKVKAGMKAGNLHEYDLSGIAQAANKIAALREEGKPVSKYLNEQKMFDEDSEGMREILRYFDENKNSTKKISQFLRNIAASIESLGDPQQADMFDDTDSVTLSEIIESAKRKGEGTSLFDDTSSTSKKSADETINAAIKADPELADFIEGTFGGKVVDGKIQADAKTKQKILNHLENLNGGNKKFSIAWHGTPHDFNNFDLGAIGTGEGAQVHGWGLYFAGNREVSEGYKEKLTTGNHTIFTGKINGKRLEGYRRGSGNDGQIFVEWTFFSTSGRRIKTFGLFSTESTALNELVKTEGNVEEAVKNLILESEKKSLDYLRESAEFLKKNKIILSGKKMGSLFKVDIPDADVMLDEDKPFSKQPPKVRKAVEEIFADKGLKLTDKLTGRDIYKKISRSPKKASELLNEYGIKGITYEGGRDGRCYVVFDDNAIKILEKFSKGKGDIRIDGFVNPKNLNSQQKAITDFGREMGTPVVFLKGSTNLNGIHANGITYINTNSDVSAEWIFSHETAHWLKANNPELYEKILDEIEITDEQRAEKKKERPDLSGKDLDEEIFADAFNNTAKRAGLLQQIGKKNPGLLRRAISWLKSVLDKVTGFFNNKEGGLTTAQKNKMYAEFKREVDKYVDEYGNKVFRMNSRTHEVQLADGTKLAGEPIQSTTGVKYSFAGEKAKTAGKDTLERAKQLEKQGKNRDEIFNETGWFKGKDDKWRFEIPDNLEKIDVRKLQNQEIGHGIRLSEIYDNPQLYQAYSWLKNIPVIPRNTLKNGADGMAHWSGEDYSYIAIGLKNLEDVPSTLVHEIQHLIQRHENFATGTSEQEAGSFIRYLNYGGEQEARTVSARAEDAAFNNREVNRLKKELKDVKTRYDNAMKNLTAEQKKLVEEYQKISEELPKAQKEHSTRFDTLYRRYLEVEDQLPGDVIDGIKNIGSLENMIRNKLTKSKKAPVVHDENAIISFGGEEYSMASVDNEADINDNSSEGFVAKIKNFFAGTKQKNTRENIREVLEGLSGMKIRFGKLEDGVDVVTKEFQKVIRSRNAYDWEKILPEVGRQVAKNLNISQSAEMSNYIADFMMTGAINNTSEQAKEFQKAMRENPEYAAQMLEVQHLFSTWKNKSASERAEETIQFDAPKKSLWERVKQFKTDFYTNFVDEYNPIKKLVEEIEKQSGVKFTDESNPEIAFRLYRGMAGLAKLMIETDGKRTADAVNALKMLNPNLKWENFKPVTAILEKAGALKDTKTYKDFSKYVSAFHIKDQHLMNHEIDKKSAEVQAKIDKLTEKIKNETDKAKIKKSEKTLGNMKKRLEILKNAKYETPMTEEDCDEIIAEFKGREGFEESRKDLVHYSNTLLAMLADSGVISRNTFFNTLKRWKNYVPLFRVFEENEDMGFGDSLKRLEGSSRDFIDPIQSIINNTYDLVKRAEKNKAKCLLANIARCGGVGDLISIDEENAETVETFDPVSGEFIEEVANNKPGDGTVITFKEDGKIKYLQTDPAVVKAVNNMTIPQPDWYTKVLRDGTVILRNTATIYNPAFAFVNVVRDYANAFVYCKHGFFSPFDVIKGFVHAFKQDEMYQMWLASGGAQASFWSVDRDYTQASIDKITKGRFKQYASIKGLGKLFSALGEYSEIGTRIGFFEKSLKAAKKNNGGEITHNDVITAAFESRDLIDFARGGKASRSWNTVSAFANATIQGWDKFYRTFDPRKALSKDAKTRRECAGAWARLFTAAVLPAVALFFKNRDKDWYKDDVQDWEKQAYWILSEDVRVPKGQDFGIRIFSTLTESFLNYSYNKDKKAFDKIYKPFIDAMPDLLPTAMKPVIECIANYNFFTGNKIVPQRLENNKKLEEKYKYDYRTSGLAKFIGEKINYSPMKIDHFIYGYTGRLGREGIRIGDAVTGSKDYNFKLPNDIPLIGGYFRMPYKNPKVVTDYYETVSRQEELHGTFEMTKKQPEGYNPKLYAKYKANKKAMDNLAKAERAVIANPKLSNAERERQQKELQKKRIEVVKRVLSAK